MAPTPMLTPPTTPMDAHGAIRSSSFSILSFKLSIISSSFMLKSVFYSYSPTTLRFEAKSSTHLAFVQNSELVAFSTTNPRNFGPTQLECQSECIVLRRKRYDAIRVGYG